MYILHAKHVTICHAPDKAIQRVREKAVMGGKRGRRKSILPLVIIRYFAPLLSYAPGAASFEGVGRQEPFSRPMGVILPLMKIVMPPYKWNLLLIKTWTRTSLSITKLMLNQQNILEVEIMKKTT